MHREKHFFLRSSLWLDPGSILLRFMELFRSIFDKELINEIKSLKDIKKQTSGDAK